MAKQPEEQKEIVGRVMHEFKQGGLETGTGKKVRNPKQAIAVALREADASRDETPRKTRENPRRTRAGRRDAGRSKSELHAEARRKGIAGRSKMTKDELVRAITP